MEKITSLLKMIEDFRRITLKKLKKQIFPPILRDDPNRFQMKLQREQYISFFCCDPCHLFNRYI